MMTSSKVLISRPNQQQPCHAQSETSPNLATRPCHKTSPTALLLSIRYPLSALLLGVLLSSLKTGRRFWILRTQRPLPFSSTAKKLQSVGWSDQLPSSPWCQSSPKHWAKFAACWPAESIAEAEATAEFPGVEAVTTGAGVGVMGAGAGTGTGIASSWS